MIKADENQITFNPQAECFDVHCYAVVIELANDSSGTKHPISPWFKTAEEAREFQKKMVHRFRDCKIGHWCFEAQTEKQRREIISDIFGAH
ncbi:MAG: hypothetical protein M8364_11575 [Methylobacter sp.]|uniref:hypothetical protein n=1 Tax=Methylobacter sp. TaxID=2051955 RepID=UPI00258271BC|nr:hypothetical protein [Methylobacter sp.]MCL7421532.1 hypothetical protein [Methylobacter sp.]